MWRQNTSDERSSGSFHARVALCPALPSSLLHPQDFGACAPLTPPRGPCRAFEEVQEGGVTDFAPFRLSRADHVLQRTNHNHVLRRLEIRMPLHRA